MIWRMIASLYKNTREEVALGQDCFVETGEKESTFKSDFAKRLQTLI